MKAWIARDADGELWLYIDEPPTRTSVDWYPEPECCSCSHELDPSLFPEVKWEDEEPTEVEIILKPIKK